MLKTIVEKIKIRSKPVDFFSQQRHPASLEYAHDRNQPSVLFVEFGYVFKKEAYFSNKLIFMYVALQSVSITVCVV